MKKIRFTESQIVSILKLADSGMKIDEICRQNGISNATYYNWKSKYGGMEVDRFTPQQLVIENVEENRQLTSSDV